MTRAISRCCLNSTVRIGRYMTAQNHHDSDYLIERDRALHPRRIARLSTTILLAAYLFAALTVFA